jgi:hypothetical protein
VTFKRQSYDSDRARVPSLFRRSVRRMVDGVPTIAWTGFDNFTPIAPLAKIR